MASLFFAACELVVSASLAVDAPTFCVSSVGVSVGEAADGVSKDCKNWNNPKGSMAKCLQNIKFNGKNNKKVGVFV